MGRSSILFLLVALLLLISRPLLADEVSREIRLEDAPAAAQNLIRQEKNSAYSKIGGIEKVVEDGETRFDVELVKGKTSRSFSVSPEGKLLSWQVFLSEVPEPVQTMINAQVKLAHGELGDIDRITEDQKIQYDFEIVKQGRTNSVSVSAEGKLLSQEILLGETPTPVRKTIEAQTGSTVKKIEKNIDEDDGEITYDVTIERNGKKTSITIDAKGGVIDSEN